MSNGTGGNLQGFIRRPALALKSDVLILLYHETTKSAIQVLVGLAVSPGVVGFRSMYVGFHGGGKSTYLDIQYVFRYFNIIILPGTQQKKWDIVLDLSWEKENIKGKPTKK